ncbi:mannitol dehydrogenase family protein [Variovorax sp. HJSM1_2]|uniref:mannitol dehydrogenase family protein n=1 Tax=Variovorax sp. HJSM1_2 TaxID=3366263 RepID=UPI003BE6BAD8
MVTPRLHPSLLPQLPSAVIRPLYDRAALRPGIVHLGVGAFQRAHLGVINEAAVVDTNDMSWGMVGVSLRRADTRDALQPQAGLYTVAVRDADEKGQPRELLQVIGNLLEVLVAPENPGAVLERLASVDTRIISLTVTEKGYCHDPATLALRWQDPDITHDLAHPLQPRSAIGMLVRGLALRHARGLAPVTLLSLDNLPANGCTLRGLVLAFAHRVAPALAEWIARDCTFPNSMVDRIVPRTTDEDRARTSERLGLEDAWPVLAEPFLEWVVEDRFAAGRPAWQAGGARFVERAEPYELLKLRMVNGTHSALSYLGVMAGWPTVDVAVAQPALRGYLLRLMTEEIEPTLPALPGLDVAAYRERLLARYANPALQHQTRQIAMDGSQKLPQRLLGSVRQRLASGGSIRLLALALAAWLHHLQGVDEAGRKFEIQDPQAAALADALALAHAAVTSAEPTLAAQQRTAAFCHGVPLFGELAASPVFVNAVARHWQRLSEDGVAATLGAL